MKILFAILLTSLLYSNEPNFYAGLGGFMSSADSDRMGCRASAISIAGIRYNNISLETRYSAGLSGDDISYGLFLKPYYTSIYGLLGYGRAKDNLGYRNSFMYGFGIEYSNFFVDAVYRDEEQYVTTTVGYIYKF